MVLITGASYIWEGLTVPFVLWGIVYVFLAMKRYYNRSFFKTLFYFLTLNIVYFIMVALLVAGISYYIINAI